MKSEKDEKSMEEFKIKIQSQEERAILDLETVQIGEEGTVSAFSVHQGYGTSDIPYLMLHDPISYVITTTEYRSLYKLRLHPNITNAVARHFFFHPNAEQKMKRINLYSVLTNRYTRFLLVQR